MKDKEPGKTVGTGQQAEDQGTSVEKSTEEKKEKVLSEKDTGSKEADIDKTDGDKGKVIGDCEQDTKKGADKDDVMKGKKDMKESIKKKSSSACILI